MSETKVSWLLPAKTDIIATAYASRMNLAGKLTQALANDLDSLVRLAEEAAEPALLPRLEATAGRARKLSLDIFKSNEGLKKAAELYYAQQLDREREETDE